MAEVLKKFGRYFLLDHLAQGGMAEIFRARLASSDGAGRIIVIKRIQGGFGANKEFLQMFKSEIKVTMGFNHPNIVQLYDFGEENDQPFIAMEWMDGRNLRQLTTRFAELKQPFPVELVSYIIEQSAAGLHYAHSFKDKITGTPLNIVHRDISPQNILVSFEGGVKVIDFGIAKATTNVESTRAGVIKGKPSYLSPEQISGETLDGRSDIFALGAVFWELLTGRKLFAGDSDLAVLKLIESCQTHVKPPSTLNPKIPKELDYIVLRTLAKQKEKRFQTAEELQRALHKFLFSYMPEFNPSDLSFHARDLFKNEIVEDRKLMQKLHEKAEKILSLNRENSNDESQSSDENTEAASPRKKNRNEEDSTVSSSRSLGELELTSDHKKHPHRI
jgi:serine/threonine-protein kinase